MLPVSLPIDYSNCSTTGIRQKNVAPAGVRVKAASSDCGRHLQLRRAQITISRSPVRLPTDVESLLHNSSSPDALTRRGYGNVATSGSRISIEPTDEVMPGRLFGSASSFMNCHDLRAIDFSG
jgi:hypothetical protein